MRGSVFLTTTCALAALLAPALTGCSSADEVEALVERYVRCLERHDPRLIDLIWFESWDEAAPDELAALREGFTTHLGELYLRTWVAEHEIIERRQPKHDQILVNLRLLLRDDFGNHFSSRIWLELVNRESRWYVLLGESPEEYLGRRS